jgi:CheY-like chemotaxis protein
LPNRELVVNCRAVEEEDDIMVKNVLVVDDEPDILLSIKMLLERDGYNVTAVDSGEKVLQLLKKKKYDLVLLDLLMPNMAGDVVADKIRKNPITKNQKFAFLTVVTAHETATSIIKKLKPADYIQKPFETADFRERVKKMLELQ